MATLWLQCVVVPGQFSDEYAVCARQSSGKEFSLFASHDDVECEKTPTHQHPQKGWLRVSVLEQQKDHAIVRLPQQSFECGQFATVSVSELQPK